MSDFRTVLIEDSRIADITATEVFGVQASASQSTYQQFQAVSTSNSSVVFNVQIPSENIVIDRHVLLASQVAFEINISNVPVDEPCFQYGVTEALQAFPLNSLFTTTQATINNVSVSTNLQDVLPMLMRMTDQKKLMKYNSTTPALPDCAWGMYYNGKGTNSNPLAGYNNTGYDAVLQPRGGYHLDFIQIDHWVGGVYADHEIISTDLTDTWRVFIKVSLCEPFLALSPFINCDPGNSAGIVGVNNMSMVLNVDGSCKRLFSTANSKVTNGGNTFTSYINKIQLGWADAPEGGASQTIGFLNTRLLFNFLSLQPEQYAKISTKNVVPYLDYPRYLTTFSSGTTIAPVDKNDVTTTRLTSQSIQLNQVPDLILICARVPMSQQDWKYSSSFLSINGISVNFNNSSGLLASATQQDLYNISARNGSSQSFYEFRGLADSGNLNGADPLDGLSIPVATTGSLLVLNPVYDFGLPSYLSSSSLGQYQFQFNVDVYNQFDYTVSQPELCIITINSGVFATQQGTSQIFTGILTKEQVLRTKEQNPVPHLDSVEYKRMVGGKLQNRGMGNLMKMVRDKIMARHAPPAVPSGGAMSAGAMSGAGISAGKKSSSKLAKFLA